jgi:hypothetical protein
MEPTADETEAAFIRWMEEARVSAVFPKGDPEGRIPPIEVTDSDTGEVICLLSDDDWLVKYRLHRAWRGRVKDGAHRMLSIHSLLK